MKKIFLLITLLFGFSGSAQSVTRKVLFVGNSYTEVNNLPQLIASAAASVGDILIFDSHTPGGYTLMQHSTNAVTQNKIRTGNWDHVVLQGQSQEAITGESDFYTGATDLNTLIRKYNPCSETLFYVTWGRKNGDAINCPNIPVLCTYETMDAAITNTYVDLATYLQTEVSPVAAVWKYLRAQHPNIELYAADESHPSAAGSYAAACSFYATIFRKNPALISFNYDLSPADAAVIRNAAKTIVYDHLSSWDFKLPPVANFDYATGNGINEVVFANAMQNASAYLWDFGDGTSSSNIVNPNHNYENNGTYTVTLTASNCDLQGVHQNSYAKNISFCSHTPTITPATVMLCPDSGERLWTETGDSYQWYDHGVLIPGATNQYFDVTASANRDAALSVMTTMNGCPELSRQSSVGVYRWMFSMLSVNVEVGANVFDGNKICLGETLSLNAQVNEPHLTQWYRNNVPIPFANNDLLLVSESGTYKAKIDHPVCTNMGAFSDLFMDPLQYEFIDCSLANAEFKNAFSVSPNPVKNTLSVQSRETVKEVLICDMLGKVLSVKASDKKAIDVSFLDRGLYIVKLTTVNNQTYTQKFLKE